MIRIIRKLLKMDPDFPHLSPELVDFHAPEEVKFNKELCKACKGLCCQRFGCFFSPRDFKKITFKDLYPEIEKGYIQIVYIPKSRSGQGTGVFVLAMRNQNGPVVNIPIRYTGPCMMLTDEGCKLPDMNVLMVEFFFYLKEELIKKLEKHFLNVKQCIPNAKQVSNGSRTKRFLRTWHMLSVTMIQGFLTSEISHS